MIVEASGSFKIFVKDFLNASGNFCEVFGGLKAFSIYKLILKAPGNLKNFMEEFGYL